MLGLTGFLVIGMLGNDAADAAGLHLGMGMLRVHERAVDLDHDGIFDLLRIDAEAQLDEAGTYWIQPYLSADTSSNPDPPIWGHGLDELASWQAERWPLLAPMRPSSAVGSREVTTDADLRIRFTCWFSGDDLELLGRDGPWQFCPIVSDVRGFASAGSRVQDLPACAVYNLSAKLRPWRHRRFGAWPVFTRNVTWQLVQPDGVALVVPMVVNRAGRHRFRLYASYGTYAADSTVVRLSRDGADTLRVTLRLRHANGSVPIAVSPTGLRLAVHLPVQPGTEVEGTWRYPGEQPFRCGTR